MAERHDTMMNPPIETLLGHTSSSKFRLVTVAARRARQINAYFGQLGEGLGAMVPPQVTSMARKPLSIAFEEIDAGKIVAVERVENDQDAGITEQSRDAAGTHGEPPASPPDIPAGAAEDPATTGEPGEAGPDQPGN